MSAKRKTKRASRSSMTGAQYDKHLERVGLSQRAAGAWLGIDERTSRRYVEGGPPESVAKLLRLMVKLKLTFEEVA